MTLRPTDHRFTPDDNPHRPDATRCAWCGLGENAHPGRIVGVIVPALDADHVPGTDRYDGRDGSIEDDNYEPSEDNPWASGRDR